jgi:hypothetical protein
MAFPGRDWTFPEIWLCPLMGIKAALESEIPHGSGKSIKESIYLPIKRKEFVM